MTGGTYNELKTGFWENIERDEVTGKCRIFNNEEMRTPQQMLLIWPEQ
jgi:hypothetical protein